MEYTLTIYDGTESTTLNLADNPASSGYHLLRYAPVFPALTNQVNDSIYTDGSRAVFGRAENVKEQITIDVVGSSMDDLFVKFRALQRAMTNADDYIKNPMLRQCSYITLQYPGMANACYAVLYGGTVDAPMLDAELQAGAGSEGELLSFVISNVVITIEREPYWRGYPPGIGSFLVWGQKIDNLTSGIPWGTQAASISGDVDGLPWLAMFPGSKFTLDRMIVAYASQKRYGSCYNAAGIIEAEGATLYNGSSLQADATASGNSKVRTSYSTNAGNVRRFSLNPAIWGEYRVFMRAKLTGGTGNWNVSLNWGDSSSSMATNAAVAVVNSTTWTMYDLGAVMTPLNAGSLIYDPANGSTYYELWAQKISGSVDLEIDFLWFAPLENYVKAQGLNLGAGLAASCNFIYDNVSPTRPITGAMALGVSGNLGQYAPALVTGRLGLPPGEGMLYWMTGAIDWANDNSEAAQYGLFCYTPLYLTARGNT